MVSLERGENSGQFGMPYIYTEQMCSWDVWVSLVSSYKTYKRRLYCKYVSEHIEQTF